jgi:hypothetical protein
MEVKAVKIFQVGYLFWTSVIFVNSSEQRTNSMKQSSS